MNLVHEIMKIVYEIMHSVIHEFMNKKSWEPRKKICREEKIMDSWKYFHEFMNFIHETMNNVTKIRKHVIHEFMNSNSWFLEHIFFRVEKYL